MNEINTSSSDPLVEWEVPGIDGQGSTGLSVCAGQALVLVGANGAGKSALSYWMSVNRGHSSAQVSRVIAHRRIWLNSSGPELTTSQRIQLEPNFVMYDSQAASRTAVQMEDQRSARVLYDLIGRVNGRNARAASRYDSGQVSSADDEIEEDILAAISRVFAAANLALSFRVTEDGGIETVNEAEAAYPIAQMSDGEKSAFLLAAEAMLLPAGGVLLVDEPERHLHRSISSDFIIGLMAERSECGFVLLTHDLDLIGKLDPSSAAVCTVSDVSWSGEAPTGWKLRIEPGSLDVPDAVRQAILGGRAELLFVEGEVSSLDFPLYRLLYPRRTVVPCGGSDEVKRAVFGIRSSAMFHWVNGRGVLDGDARNAEEIGRLAAKGILVLPVNEVENLYFLSWIVQAVASSQALALGENADLMATQAKSKGLASLKPTNIQHLASVNAAKILRQQAMASLPTSEELASAGSTISLNLSSAYDAQRQDLETCIAGGDYDGVVQRFSIRDSGFLTAVSDTLRFRKCDDYEKAVRTRLGNDAVLVAKLQKTAGDLPI